MIKIQGKEFEFEPIRLKSVRPFLFEEVSLANCHDPENKINLNTKVSVNKFLKKKVRFLALVFARAKEARES